MVGYLPLFSQSILCKPRWSSSTDIPSELRKEQSRSKVIAWGFDSIRASTDNFQHEYTPSVYRGNGLLII